MQESGNAIGFDIDCEGVEVAHKIEPGGKRRWTARKLCEECVGSERVETARPAKAVESSSPELRSAGEEQFGFIREWKRDGADRRSQPVRKRRGVVREPELKGAGTAIEQSEVERCDVAGKVEVSFGLCGMEAAEVEIRIGGFVFTGRQERPCAADAGGAEPPKSLEFFDYDGGIAVQFDASQSFGDVAKAHDWRAFGCKIGEQASGPPRDTASGHLCLSPFHVVNRTVSGVKCKLGRGDRAPVPR